MSRTRNPCHAQSLTPLGTPLSPPEGQGLYDPRAEHDACGVGFVVHMKGRRSHDIVRKAMQVLINLEHRGACGCEANTGDGAGILVQMPDTFLRKVVSFALPPAGAYGAGLVFLPRDARDRDAIKAAHRPHRRRRGADAARLARRAADNSLLGDSAKATQPVFQQVFIGAAPGLDGHARSSASCT